MSTSPRYNIKPRRRRTGKTDYRQRLKLLKSRKTRMVVRKSLKHTLVQFVDYTEKGDKIIATAKSQELVSKYNWKHSTSSTPAAYLTGLIAAKRAKDKGIKECILDIGRYPPVTGSKVFASLKGAIDAGITCNHDETKLPSDDRISGKEIDKELKNSVDQIKNKIIGGK